MRNLIEQELLRKEYRISGFAIPKIVNRIMYFIQSQKEKLNPNLKQEKVLIEIEKLEKMLVNNEPEQIKESLEKFRTNIESIFDSEQFDNKII